jgi:putative transposase
VGRPLRIVDTEAIYHVFARGNNKGEIAWDGQDGDVYVSLLSRAARRFRWEVYAWCLMPNHHHVVLRAPQDGLSDGFRLLNGNYARVTNRRHGRVDHLFRNRFRWVELASDAHLIGAIAYVVRNPVKAGLCAHAGEWRHSSYRATVGRAPSPPWLVVDRVLELFGSSPEEARRAFEAVVHHGRLVVSDTTGDHWPLEPYPVRL